MSDLELLTSYLKQLEEYVKASTSTITELLIYAIEYDPTPRIIYSKDDRVIWCNKVMLDHFFSAHSQAELGYIGSDCFGEKIEDVFPKQLSDYILAQNSKVFATRKRQVESWSDQNLIGKCWKVTRYWITTEHVCAILEEIPNEDFSKWHQNQE